MKIGVISDTHDHVFYVRKAVTKFNDEGVDLVVHCGDWVAPFVVGCFKTLKAPLRGVFGNNDGDKFRHLVFKNNWGIDFELEDRFLKLETEGRTIAVLHGDVPEVVDALVKCGDYDAVFHGHTHRHVNETVGKTLSLNPGALMDNTADSTREAGFAIYDTVTNTAEYISMESL